MSLIFPSHTKQNESARGNSWKETVTVGYFI